MEVERIKRDLDRGSPTIRGNLCCGVPEPVPAGVHDGVILRRRSLFDDFSVPLGAERVHLEDVSVPVTSSRINENGKVIVQVLREITAKLGRDYVLRTVIVAVDSKVNVLRVEEDADLGLFRCWLSLKRLALTEVPNDRS